MKLAEKKKQRVKGLLKDRLASNGHSYSPNSLKNAAEWARQCVEVEEKIENLMNAKLVRLTIIQDDITEFADLIGDMFDEDHENWISGGKRALTAQYREYKRRIEDCGVWFCRMEWRCDSGDDWQYGDCIGGIEGDYANTVEDQLVESGYWHDMAFNTLERIRAGLKSRCKCCGRASYE